MLRGDDSSARPGCRDKSTLDAGCRLKPKRERSRERSPSVPVGTIVARCGIDRARHRSRQCTPDRLITACRVKSADGTTERPAENAKQDGQPPKRLPTLRCSNSTVTAQAQLANYASGVAPLPSWNAISIGCAPPATGVPVWNSGPLAGTTSRSPATAGDALHPPFAW